MGAASLVFALEYLQAQDFEKLVRKNKSLTEKLRSELIKIGWMPEYYQRKLRLAMHKSRPSAPPERSRPRELHAKVQLGGERFDREHVRMHEVMFKTPHDAQEQEATKSRKRQMNIPSTLKRTL